jgi:hypothetical protein
MVVLIACFIMAILVVLTVEIAVVHHNRPR